MELALKGDAGRFVDALLAAISQSEEQGILDLTSSELSSSSQSSSGSSSNSKEVADLNKVKDFMAASLRIVSQKLAKQIKEEATDDAKCGGNGQIWLKMDDLQCFEPRGRFNASFTSSGLLLEGKNANGFIPWESVSHVSAFPSNATTKKEGEDLLAMRLSPAVKFAGKDMSGILFNLSKCLGTPIKATLPASALHGRHEATAIEGIHSAVVPQAIEALWGKAVVAPRKELFQTIGMGPGGATRPYLRCHKGVQEGAIYPLSNGVVFVKPLLFLPAEEIASLSAGRGGGSGQTRYVDLKIETADDKVFEFVNIEREELPALQGYVKGYLEARAKEANAEKARAKREEGGECNASADDDDDSDSEEDEDFDPDASEDDDDDDSDADDDDDNSDVSDDEDAGAPGPAKKRKRERKRAAKKSKKSKGKSPKKKTLKKASPGQKENKHPPASTASSSRSSSSSSSSSIAPSADNEMKVDED